MSRTLSILFAFLVTCANIAQAQGSSDVLKSFRKLEADTEAGMNYSEYARAISEVNAQLKSFADSNPGKRPPSIDALHSALALYLKAKDLWDDQQIRDAQYHDGKIAIRTYYEGKRANLVDISTVWKRAGQEIDRASALLRMKQQSQRKPVRASAPQ